MKRLTNHILLTEEEYEDLSNPDKCYTKMTKSAAKVGVKNLLKHFKFECYHDMSPVPGYDDACCGVCPVIAVLGHDVGERMCERSKWWSK